MRWDYRFTEIQEEVKRVSAKADALAEAYAEAEDFTLRFLKQCSKHKVKLNTQKHIRLSVVGAFLRKAEILMGGR